MTASPINPDANRHHQGAPATRCTPSTKACAFHRVPEGTLRYWRHLGCGPRRFKVGRHVCYWRADLVLWLAEHSSRTHGHC